MTDEEINAIFDDLASGKIQPVIHYDYRSAYPPELLDENDAG